MEMSQRTLVWKITLFFLLGVCSNAAMGYSQHGNNLTAFQSWCHCECLGGVLATVKTEEEADNLNTTNNAGWIALYRLPFINQLVWMDGSARGSFETGKVHQDKPSRSKHCVYVNGTTWLTANCFEHHSAVCQNVSNSTLSDLKEEECFTNCTESIPSHKPQKSTSYLTNPSYASTVGQEITRALEATKSVIYSETTNPVKVDTTTLFPSETSQETPTTTKDLTTFTQFFVSSGIMRQPPATMQYSTATDSTEESTLTARATLTTATRLTTTQTPLPSSEHPTTNQYSTATSAADPIVSTTVTSASTNMPTLSATDSESTSQAATPTTSQTTVDATSSATTQTSPSTSQSTKYISTTQYSTKEATTSQETTSTATSRTRKTATTDTPPSVVTSASTSTKVAIKETTPTTTITTTKTTTTTTKTTKFPTTKALTEVISTQAVTTRKIIESPSEAASTVKKIEEELYNLIEPNATIPPNVQVTRLTAKDNKQYSAAKPLAVLSTTTKVNKLVPQGLGENENFVAVMAQITDDTQILKTLSKASTYASTGYQDEALVFNATPMLSITALTESKRKLAAAASFDFNLTQDPTLDAYASDKSFDLSDFYKDTQLVRKLSYECRYVDVEKHVLSLDGCVSNVLDTRGHIRCDCTHTTSFAVLLSVSSFTLPASVKILSFVTESISTVFFIATLVILVRLRKSIRNDRTVIQINLTAALLLFHICNLFHDPAQQHETSCEAIAVLTHYFILASAAWMLLEGAILARKTIGGAMDSRVTTKAKIVRYAVGWGIPAVVVFIAAVAGFLTDSYMQQNPLYQSNVGANRNIPKYTQCWLSRESGALIGAVLVPVMLVLFANAVIISKMGCFVYKMSQRSENFKPVHQRSNSSAGTKQPVLDMNHLLASIKAVAFLIPTLGLPWLFGVLAGVNNYEASVTFMYLNSIVNGLQGVMVFVIYCILGREVRNAMKSKWHQVRATSQQNFSESKSHSSIKKDSTLQKNSKTADTDRIFGIHQSTQGKFVELPRY